jgi:N-acetyllactosaminide 3-alpha-galactosyltransferase
MKVCMVSPYFAPHVGGVESHVRDLCNYLVDRGDEVTVLTSRFSRLLPRFERRGGVVIRRVPTIFNAFNTPFMPAVHREVIAGDWDIIHSHQPPPLTSYFACSAANAMGVPHVLTYHCDEEIQIPALGPVIIALFRWSLGRYTLSRSEQVMVSTRTYADTSRLVWRYEPEVTGMAIDVKCFSPSVDGAQVRERLGIPPSEEGHMILFVGRLMPHKGVEFLLEAIPMLPPSTKVVVVGSGPWREVLEASARRIGVTDRVIFAGAVPADELPMYYRAADVFVLPSISRLEAFGLVGLETLASERPVVLSDIPGVREVIEDGREGLLARPTDPADLAEKINILLKDPKRRAAMGKRGRRRVLANFTMEVVGAKIRKVYERVLSDEKPDIPRAMETFK